MQTEIEVNLLQCSCSQEIILQLTGRHLNNPFPPQWLTAFLSLYVPKNLSCLWWHWTALMFWPWILKRISPAYSTCHTSEITSNSSHVSLAYVPYSAAAECDREREQSHLWRCAYENLSIFGQIKQMQWSKLASRTLTPDTGFCSLLCSIKGWKQISIWICINLILKREELCVQTMVQTSCARNVCLYRTR